MNDEVRYPRFLSLEAIAIMRRVSSMKCSLGSEIQKKSQIFLLPKFVFSCFGRIRNEGWELVNATLRT